MEGAEVVTTIGWTVDDRGVAELTFDQEARLNALTPVMVRTAIGHLRAAADDPAVTVVVLTGRGRAFSSGADLRAEAAPDPPPASALLDAVNELVLTLRWLPKPVIAAINGPAAGVGCSIALACDLVYAVRSSYLLLAFANVGLIPDGGATWSVVQAIGGPRAFEMTFRAKRLDADRACAWGLVNDVFDDGTFRAEVGEVARELASGPPLAYAEAKAAINRVAWGGIEEQLEVERASQLELMSTDDHAEAVSAFRARRPARFLGR